MELKKTVFLATILALSTTHFVTATTKASEKEFRYLNGHEHGPEKWGELNEEWKMCSKGKTQSPIDLLENKVDAHPELGQLQMSYEPSPASLVNRGHDIMLQWKNGGGEFNINGTKYTLKQIHWHSPSEHTIDGARYALESHMVHETTDKKIAVIAILYKYGRSNKFLSKLTSHIPAIAHKEIGEKDIGVLDPEMIQFGSRKYYRYIGSLTNPPCTEGVTWTIIKKIRTVSREQVRLLKTAVHEMHNARPIQPINARVVEFYTPRNAEY